MGSSGCHTIQIIVISTLDEFTLCMYGIRGPNFREINNLDSTDLTEL